MGPNVSRYCIYRYGPYWCDRGGGFHRSKEPKDHYTVRGFRPNGHAYKTLHIFSISKSDYFKKSGGDFSEYRGMTLDLLLECEDLGYVISIFSKFLVFNG
jgi:hypothetical protein